jgi:large subunit ribosomal protein L32
MPPLPKRKLSKGRRDRRRSHLALTPTHMVACTNCHKPHLPHTVCPYCGYYNGEEVFAVEDKTSKK